MVLYTNFAKHLIDMHPEEDEVLTYDIARMCSIKVTMAIDLKNQKQGTIERKNVKRFMEKFKFNWSTVGTRPE